MKFRPPIANLDDDEELKSKFSGKCLLTVSCDGHICHWNAASGKLQHTITHERNGLSACDFKPDGLQFVAAGVDGRIYLYDEVTRQQIACMYSNGLKLPGHVMQVFATKFLPNDGNIVLTSGWDKTVKIYDLRCKYPVDQILGPLVSSDSLDVADDTIVAGSKR